jgi:N-acetylneuraminate lyase
MLKQSQHLTGPVAATHTPFDSQLELNLDAIERQAEYVSSQGIRTVFIAGSTGESHSLTLNERLALATRWADVLHRSPMQLIVHVGSNCLADARTLAAHAQSIKAHAIAALAPSYFKPATLDLLIGCCADIAAAAPQAPFYFYDIPALTGVQFSMPDFLSQAVDRIPTLAGIKFTNMDMLSYQRCLHTHDGGFDIPWGVDECFLAAAALGAKAAVGSSFNFAAPIYHRMLAAYSRGQLEQAQREQFRSVQIISLLARTGYMASAKALMGLLGVDVGQPRLPHAALSPQAIGTLRRDLETIGFFEWLL